MYIKTHRNFNEIPINFILVVDKINFPTRFFGVIYFWFFFSCHWCAFSLIYVNVSRSQNRKQKILLLLPKPLSNLHTKLMNANNFFYISSVAIDWKSGRQFIRNLMLLFSLSMSSLFVRAFIQKYILNIIWRTIFWIKWTIIFFVVDGKFTLQHS